MAWVAVSSLMVSLLLGTAQAADIKVGHLADLTGPTGDVGKPYAEGVQAYKDYVKFFFGHRDHSHTTALFYDVAAR
jgi:ABC-type branched-subunit amino acid transport system substrate-binding protein